MSSYLFVTVFGGGSFLVVQATEDGVLAKAVLDFQLGLLQAAFLVKAGLLLLTLLFQSFVVGEEVELLGLLWLLGDGGLWHDMIDAEV